MTPTTALNQIMQLGLLFVLSVIKKKKKTFGTPFALGKNGKKSTENRTFESLKGAMFYSFRLWQLISTFCQKNQYN